MNPRLAFAACLFVAGLRADDSLLRRSPFAPPTAAPPASATAPQTGTIDLLGVTSIAGEILLNLFDRAANRGAWVPVGGRWGSFEVLSFDPGRKLALLNGPAGRLEVPLRVATGEGGQPVVTPQPVPLNQVPLGGSSAPTTAAADATPPPGLAEVLTQTAPGGAPIAARPQPGLLFASRQTLPRAPGHSAEAEPPQPPPPPVPADLPAGSYRYFGGMAVPPGFSLVSTRSGDAFVVPHGGTLPPGYNRLITTPNVPDSTTPIRRPRLILNDKPAPDTPPPE